MRQVIYGDVRTILPTLPDQSVQTCVTSPPYFGLRDYGHEDQIGLEPTVEAFVDQMVTVFREVRRVLKDDGTLWLNLGDSYAANRAYQVPSTKGGPKHSPAQGFDGSAMTVPDGLKPKDLIGIPWRVAFALQSDGWYLRQDIIWHKPNPMPESVRVRPTKSHEYLFLLSKSPRYYYDAAAIAERTTWELQRSKMPDGWDTGPGGHGSYHRNGREKGAPASHRGSHFDQGKTADHQLGRSQKGPRFGGNKYGDDDADQSRTKSGNEYHGDGKRNKRSVWTVSTMPYSGAHFATFPPKLIEPCILAGSRPGDVVLDPFAGSGTTLQVADKHGRGYIGIELNPDNKPLIDERLAQPSLWQMIGVTS
jgi:site-specific DNA-methyltransferase (cytosine-N4-specific)